jgi:PUA domain protein
MLKKPEEIRSSTQLKSSAIRGLKSSVSEKFTGMDKIVQDLFTPDFPVIENKLKAPHNDISLISVNNTILFIQNSEVTFPHLRICHQFPNLMKKMQVDRGAIKFVLGGANIMCRGLTSPGGRMEEAEEGELVSIIAEGKTTIMAIGIMRKSTSSIRSENNGIGIELLHYLGDGIWKMKLGN